jgi:hypothetical protein
MTTPDIIALVYMSIGCIWGFFEVKYRDYHADIKAFGYITIWPLILLCKIIIKTVEYFENNKRIQRSSYMPYDPRPISEGGNRGAGEEFSLKAPKGKYRVISVDTFDGGDCNHGDFRKQEDAIKEAKEHSGTMQKSYVYDDKGQCVWSGGTF